MPYHIVAIHIIELIAALAGTYYYFKTMDGQMRLFVWYLWFIVFIETLGMYSYFLHSNYDYEWFIWLKNSVICSNIWLYNIFSFVCILIYGRFFLGIITHKLSKIIIKLSVILYSIFTSIYFLVSDTFSFCRSRWQVLASRQVLPTCRLLEPLPNRHNRLVLALGPL